MLSMVRIDDPAGDSEPFSSFDLAGLKNVDGLGHLAGLSGAAVELAQDVPRLRALAGGHTAPAPGTGKRQTRPPAGRVQAPRTRPD
jgi:hypothetical protein